MVKSPVKPNLEGSAAKTKALKENILTPRFYTTDFEKAAQLDLSAQELTLPVLKQRGFLRTSTKRGS